MLDEKIKKIKLPKVEFSGSFADVVVHVEYLISFRRYLQYRMFYQNPLEVCIFKGKSTYSDKHGKPVLPMKVTIDDRANIVPAFKVSGEVVVVVRADTVNVRMIGPEQLMARFKIQHIRDVLKNYPTGSEGWKYYFGLLATARQDAEKHELPEWMKVL